MSGPYTECLSKKETDTWNKGSASDATKPATYPENVPRPDPQGPDQFETWTHPQSPPPPSAYTKAADAYARIKAIYKELSNDSM